MVRYAARSLCARIFVLAAFLLPSISTAAPGDLDQAFGLSGVSRFSNGNPGDTTILATAKQADGKVLVAGEVRSASASYALVGRINTDGSWDTTFGSGGLRVIPDASSATAITVTADGKSVVGLMTNNGYEPAMVKLDASGALDTLPCCQQGAYVRAYDSYGHRITAIAEAGDGTFYWVTTGIEPYAYENSRTTVYRIHPYGYYYQRYDVEMADGFEKARAVLVEPDGKLLIAGWGSIDWYSSTLYTHDAVVVKLDPATGQLDPAFGVSGKLVVDFNGGGDEFAALVRDPQGRVLALGKAGFNYSYNGESEFGFVRFDPATGALDPTFGVGGKQHLAATYDSFPGGQEAVALDAVVLPSGEIIAAGFTRMAQSYQPNYTSRSVLMRLDANAQGTVGSFGWLGLVVSDQNYTYGDSFVAVTSTAGTLMGIGNRADGSYPAPTARVIRQRVVESSGLLDGSVLVTRASLPTAAVGFVTAISPTGRIATVGDRGTMSRIYARTSAGDKGDFLGYQGSWQFSGYQDLQIDSMATSARAIAFQPDDSILVASLVGDQTTRWAVSRFEPVRGFFDGYWGSNGNSTIMSLQNGDIAAIAVQLDGKVVVAGTAQSGYQSRSFALARLSSNGMLDTAFNGSGVQQLAAPANDEFATALAIDNSGRILVAGYTQYPTQMKVVRLTASGSLDPSWGSGGVVVTGISGGAIAQALALQADGKVLVAGTCFQSVPEGAGCAARLNGDGSIDYSFGIGGVASLPYELGVSSVSGATTLGGGGIRVAGNADDDLPFVGAFLADGNVDTAFHGTGYSLANAPASNWSAVMQPSGLALLTGVADASGDTEVVMVRFEGDASDTTPDQFTFIDQVNVQVGIPAYAAPVTITGITDPAPISIVGGYYAVNCTGPWRDQPGSIGNGQTLCVVQFASSYPNTSTDTVVTVGGVSDTFTTTTGSAPDTSITATPASPSGPAVSFSFTSTDSSPSFACSMDGGQYVGCSNPASYMGLADGSHTFRVYSMGTNGSDPTPAEFAWTVDAVAPDTAITGGPSATTNQASATVAFSGSDAVSGVAGFECKLDAAAFAACASPVTVSGLAAGSHTFQVRAIDAVGNVDATPASRSWTVDLSPPNTAITGPTTSNQAFSLFTLGSDDPAAIFECDILGTGTFSACTSPVQTDNVAMGDGPHTIYARAKDAAGNVDPTPASWTFTIDRTAPETSFNYAPTGSTNAATVSASFFSSEQGSVFECRLDGTTFVSCTSPVSYSNLAEGSHTVEVRARDAAGNYDPTPATSSWTIDRTAPETSITVGPSGTTGQASGSFSFSSPDGSATFQCAVDSGAWFGCASPYPFYNLADGTHLFEVRAVDSAQNFDPSAASRTWTIDTTAPNTSITSGPDAITPFTGASFTFTSPDGVSFQCSLDGAAFAACTSPANYSNLAGGGHSFAVYAVDAAGNADASPATWSWAVDLVAPDTTITGGPTGTVAQSTATITFTSNDPTATFECRLDGAVFAACTSPANLSGLSSASHTFDVRAKDGAGNVDATPASRNWTVDTVAPDTTITAAPPAATNLTTASFSFTATEAGTFECKLDAGAYAACTSPKSYTGVSSGSHTFSVRAKDAVGNTDATPATATWAVDTTAPDTTITGGPSGNNNPNTATFTFTATEAGSTFECKLDTGAFAACTSPKTYTALPKGSHTFQVRATDPAGNIDASPATRSWTSK